MKRYIKISTLCLGICLSIGALIVSKSAKALREGGTKKLVSCTISSGGEITQIGNTCSSGSASCSSNPCGE